MTDSVSFDRAAEYYDQTRAISDDVLAQVIPTIVAELGSKGSCLEIGIGTGRIALPLAEHGVHVVGVDISAEMLRRLVEKAGRNGPPEAIADAIHLPFPDGTFASAVAAHVLHLIPGWRSAVDELARVVVPGGVLLASKGAELRVEWQARVRRHFFIAAGDPPWPPGIDRMETLDEYMRARGAAVGKVEDVRREGASTIVELIAALEKGIYAACWSIDDTTRRRAAATTREWASQEYGDLEASRPASHSSDWRAYRFASPRPARPARA